MYNPEFDPTWLTDPNYNRYPRTLEQHERRQKWIKLAKEQSKKILIHNFFPVI